MLVTLYSVICLWMMTIGTDPVLKSIPDVYPQVAECIRDMRNWDIIQDVPYGEFLHRNHEEDELFLQTMRPNGIHDLVYYSIYDFVLLFDDRVASQSDFVPFVEFVAESRM